MHHLANHHDARDHDRKAAGRRSHSTGARRFIEWHRGRLSWPTRGRSPSPDRQANRLRRSIRDHRAGPDRRKRAIHDSRPSTRNDPTNCIRRKIARLSHLLQGGIFSGRLLAVRGADYSTRCRDQSLARTIAAAQGGSSCRGWRGGNMVRWPGPPASRRSGQGRPTLFLGNRLLAKRRRTPTALGKLAAEFAPTRRGVPGDPPPRSG